MARFLKPLVRSGGYYPSRRWTPLVYPGGYTTANGGEEPAPPPIEKTITGNPIHILDALAKPAQALSVKLEPIKDLHGYDNPWPAGGGKNLFDSSVFPPASASQAILYIHYEVPNGTYTMSTPDFPLVSGIANVYFLAGAVSSGASSGSNGVSQSMHRTITVTDGYYTVAYRSTNDINTNNPHNFKWQIELGNYATSWTPYENICPISGHTDADVTRTGKNLNPYEGVNYTADTHPNGFWLNAGSYVFSLDNGGEFGRGNSIYIKLKDANGNVITKGNIAGTGWYLNSSGKYYYGHGENGKTSAPFELLTDCFFCFGFNNTKPTAGGVQLEVGSTATAYEPYSGKTYSITFPTSAGTVYGGTLDVTTGKLTVDRAMVDLGTLNWFVDSRGRFQSPTPVAQGVKPAPSASVAANVLCSNYKTLRANDTYLRNIGISLDSSGTCHVYDPSFPDAASFKAAMSGVQLVYELATPIVYDLTPTQIDMLLGENNLWADAGDSTLTYYADGNASASEALGILLGGTYNNLGGADDVSDDEALGILLGGS